MEEKDSKTCFKCGRTLPITEFYAHPRMGDGHLNKCKDCTKHDVHVRHYINTLDPDWVEKERKRCRDKHARLYSGGRRKCRHPETKDVRRHFKLLGYDLGGKELHHWNYGEKFDVFVLTPSQHKRIHLKLEYDEETKLFRYHGRLIRTRDEHQRVIEEILSTPIPLF